MTIYGKDVVEIFINWFPMLLLIGVWIFFLRRVGGTGWVTKYQRDHLDLTRRQVEAFERIAAALEKQTR
jgi:ATP-dependent Zn protease